LRLPIAVAIVYDFGMKTAWVIALVAAVAVGCLAFVSQQAAAQAPDVGARVAEIFRDKCIDCHGADMAKPKAGFKGVELVDELLKNPKYVKRFDPANSLLYQYLSGAQTPQMPKGDDPLSEEELAAVRAWIGEKPSGGGAAPVAPAAFKARPIVDDEAVVKIIHADLASLPAAERVHYRYITYTNLWNERIPEGASAAEQAKFQNDTDELIKSTRLGFAKMLNSLSWSPAMAMPKRIDRDGLVERIDLRGILCAERQYHWSSTQWDMLCARYPYGRAIGVKQEEEIVQWLGTEMPFVRADWFVFATSRPPLYHDLLGLPGGDRKPGADAKLERMLGVDVRKNILEGMHVARAGIRDKQSGVSQHNRLIERHELSDGAYYWKSYDFEDSVGTGNLVMHPLGPSNLDGLPENQREFAFEHAGGEIIFSLPNGLQGYLLVTEDGTRIDDGPSKIVFDRDDSADVKGQITNGISCIACHSGGINLKLDQIRDGSLKILPRGLRDELEALFPANEAMDRMQKADKARFMAAVAKLGTTDGCDQTQCESVRKVSLRFSENLTFERAAAEFGASVGDFREAFGGKLKGLRAQLEAGAVSRAEFINRFRQIVADNPDFGEMSGCGAAKGTKQDETPAAPRPAPNPPPAPVARWNTNWDAEVLRQDPDPTVVTDAAARARMIATKLPWKVRDRKTGIVMLLCPPGEFMMGSPASEAGRFDDETQHRRTIGKAFYLGETEVTQEQWERVMGANPSYFAGATNPVEQVSWDDCKRFCASTGLRLPSEAEWEYACRAGTTGAYAGDLASMAWFGNNSGRAALDADALWARDQAGYSNALMENGCQPHSVRQRMANAWGLFDMHGNVLEWCEDGYGDYPAVAATQAAARAAEGGARVLRGGGWGIYASGCRAAGRGSFAPGYANGLIGFRVARTSD
jgi:formylglycine-generating enzyme required for sulfatase activity/mono/diheme cytochrome c family protein